MSITDQQLAETFGGRVEHHNGTIGIETEVITFTKNISAICIHNSHAVNTLHVSFDDGDNFFEMVASGSDLQLSDVYMPNVVVSGFAADTTYNIIAIPFKG